MKSYQYLLYYVSQDITFTQNDNNKKILCKKTISELSLTSISCLMESVSTLPIIFQKKWKIKDNGVLRSTANKGDE